MSSSPQVAAPRHVPRPRPGPREVRGGLDVEGEPVLVETSLTSRLLWMGAPGPGVPEQGSCVRLTTTLTPSVSGEHTFGLITGATGWVSIDGEVILDAAGAGSVIR